MIMKGIILITILFNLIGCQSIDEIKIDKSYLISSSKNVTINAPIDTVWKIQTDINNWKKWHSDITESDLNGGLKVGSVFLWESSGFDITSKVTGIEKHKKIEWVGYAFGAHVKHDWLFKKITPTKTLVTTNESMNGWLVSLFTGTMEEKLNTSLEKWLQQLKMESEK